MATSCPEHILDCLLVEKLRNSHEVVNITECKSAQQKVWIVELKVQKNVFFDGGLGCEFHEEIALWQDCLKMGNNRIVVRQWLGGCSWWNLNRNGDPYDLARSEVQGYRSSRESISRLRNHVDKGDQSPKIMIPRVLHASIRSEDTKDEFPWAIMEYVGYLSRYFFHRDHCHANEEKVTHKRRIYDTSFLKEMVKIRHEFGFDEPHPRWGRVPEDQSLKYAIMILEQVVLPLQENSKASVKQSIADDCLPYRSYQSMISIYEEAFADLKAATLGYGGDDKFQRLAIILELLQSAIQQVLPENLSRLEYLPPVLVHLDLQPQNLLMAYYEKGKEDKATSLHIASVLDWEDAALADPRFELLHLCRKVCANREQAEELWKHYEKNIRTESCDENHSCSLGSLRPWLQMETTHSIITLMLQSMNLLNGGRNPWENSSDLWGKIQRECSRWEALTIEGDKNMSAIKTGPYDC